MTKQLLAAHIDKLTAGIRLCIQGECYLKLSPIEQDNGWLAHLDSGKVIHWSTLVLYDEWVELL